MTKALLDWANSESNVPSRAKNRGHQRPSGLTEATVHAPRCAPPTPPTSRRSHRATPLTRRRKSNRSAPPSAQALRTAGVPRLEKRPWGKASRSGVGWSTSTWVAETSSRHDYFTYSTHSVNQSTRIRHIERRDKRAGRAGSKKRTPLNASRTRATRRAARRAWPGSRARC